MLGMALRDVSDQVAVPILALLAFELRSQYLLQGTTSSTRQQ